MGYQTETLLGEEIRVAGARLYPFAHVTGWKGRRGGLIWNRPAAVLVRHDTGREEILMVRDVTRSMQIRILLFGLIGSLLIGLISRNR